MVQHDVLLGAGNDGKQLGLLGGWAPLVFLVGFTGLELVVAFLQAFIFTVLTCIYLNDAVNMHH